MAGSELLTGRVVIVAGVGPGLGAATAKSIAAHGGAVVLAARSADKLDALAAALREQVAHRASPSAAAPPSSQPVARRRASTSAKAGRRRRSPKPLLFRHTPMERARATEGRCARRPKPPCPPLLRGAISLRRRRSIGRVVATGGHAR